MRFTRLVGSRVDRRCWKGGSGSGRGGGGGGGGGTAEEPTTVPMEAANYSASDLQGWANHAETDEVYKAIRAERIGDATPEQVKIVDNRYIASNIQEDAALNPKNFRGVRDSDGNLQAAATVKIRKNEIYIENLATAPWNVYSKNSKSTKGAGREIMLSLAKEAVSKNKSLSLSSLPGAEGFYQKVGFKLERPRKGNELAGYRMDVESAKKFIADYGR